MKDKIIPSLWFESNASDAMRFYLSVFPDSEVSRDVPDIVVAKLWSVPFIALNGRPAHIEANPAISFMVVYESKAEIAAAWAKLSQDGKVYMELGAYPWSDYYGWIGDRYGYTWQLYLGKLEDVNHQRIVPTLMFSGVQQGKCEEAVGFYQSLFPGFKSHGVMRYEEGPFQGQVVHTQFELGGFLVAATDSGVPQDFTFNEAVSLSIMCEDQDEIDHYWDGIAKQGEEIACGWCRDQYGVYWQVTPKHVESLLFEAPNAKRAFEAMTKMKKIIIKDLRNA